MIHIKSMRIALTNNLFAIGREKMAKERLNGELNCISRKRSSEPESILDRKMIKRNGRERQE